MPLRSQRRQPSRRPCNKCLDLDFDQLPPAQYPSAEIWPDDHVRSVRISINELIEAKKKGCQACFAVLKGIDLLTQEWLPPPVPTDPDPGSGSADASTPGPQTAPSGFLSMLDSRTRYRSWVQLLLRKRHPDQPSIAHPLEVICNLVLTCKITHPSGGAFIKVYPSHFSPITNQTIRFGFEIYSHPDRPAPWPAFHPARHVPVKLNSERRQKLLESWIQDCNQRHKDCRITTLESLPTPWSYSPPKRTRFVELQTWAQRKALVCGYTDNSLHVAAKRTWKPPPWRLLDLGGNPRNCIRLVDTDGLEGEYATVSHSRTRTVASSPSYTLNKNTIDQMKKRIAWADLLPAYQDAVVVAAEQGIRYLWIDALCILVDDPKERNWHVENVHQIYGQSYLNIALSQSRDDRRSSLGKRWLDPSKDAEIRTCQIDLFRDGKTWPVYVRSKLYNSHGTFQFSKTSLHHTSRNAEDYTRKFPPMFKSAWAFQERILAPRTVHFSTSEMLWECRSCMLCECNQNVCRNPTVDMLGSSKFSLAMLGVALVPLKLDKDVLVRRLWRHMWPVFSHLRTSHPKKRIQGLVGLATMFQKLLGRSFVAGMFANTGPGLARELLWGVERSASPGSTLYPMETYADTYKFYGSKVPSWTWLSMISKWPDAVGHPEIVRRGRLNISPNFEVVQISTTTPLGGTPDHPFNAENWTLHLRGEMILGKISTWDRRQRHYQFVPSNYLQFPPSLPPPPPPLDGRRPLLPGPIMNVVDVLPQSPGPTLHLPPILPAPAAYSSPSTSTGTSRSSSPETLERPLNKPRINISRPLLGQELISTMGMFTPDCDLWDEKRKEGASIGMDGIGSANHTYAYFLLLGTIAMHVTDQFTEHTDIGLVLRKSSDMWGSGFAPRGTFQRVGYFTAPRVPGPRGLGDFFKDAQVQDITLV